MRDTYLKGQDYLGDVGIDRRIILKRVWECRLKSSGSGRWSVAGRCEHYNESSVSIKIREFCN